MQRCVSCRDSCRYILEPFQCAKTAQLCKEVDVDLLEELYFEKAQRQISMAAVVTASQKIEINYNEITAQILNQQLTPPINASDGVRFVRLVGSRLFKSVGVATLGRFRIGNERVTVDHSSNEFEGVRTEQIEAAIEFAWSETMIRLQIAKSISDVAAALAYLMVQLFRIHPFRDGNGRTTRLIIQALAKTKQLRLHRFSTTPKERRRYRSALLYAHRHRRERPDGIPSDKDCWLVREYIKRHLAQEIIADVEVEPES